MLPFIFVALLSIGSWAEFGFTQDKEKIVIDSDSTPPFVFAVDKRRCDITSIHFDGHQLQSSSKGSHINSGFGKHVSVNVVKRDDHIIVNCTTSSLSHYHVVKRGVSDIFMATDAKEDSAELRFIARLDSKVLPELWPHGKVSDTGGNSGLVEPTDVYRVGNETRSKFYSSDRFIDDKWHCVAGSGLRACFILPGAAPYESSSGGPFHRDINANNIGKATHLTFYMHSNHVNTEDHRIGFFGPYILSFRKSDQFPTEKETQVDTTFFEHLSITGYEPQSTRGRVAGRASGLPASLPAVIHWFNEVAQYWATADAKHDFASPYMKPGTYTQILYQDEREVSRIEGVKVVKGETTRQDIRSAWPQREQHSLFRIGVWDGKPTGFRNADKQLRMHPSDLRMESWESRTYKVGESKETDFPMALWQSVNSPLRIEFNLDHKQNGNLTLWIGTTLSYSRARPEVIVNGHRQPLPAPGKDIKSRGVTRGAYRGHGDIFKSELKADLLKEGINVLEINAASGETGVGFLSPNFIFDAVEVWRQ